MNQNQQPNEKKYNYFYKIINLINGKYYYGIHSTNNLEDGYKGGGTLLMRSIKKHGWENFTKEIVADYPTRKETSDHERLVVTMELVLDENCYNLRCGGDNEYGLSMAGELNPFYGRKHSDKTKQKLRELNLGNQPSNETRQKISAALTGIVRSDEYKEKLSKTKQGVLNPFYGKKFTEEHRNNISKALIGGKRSIESRQKMSEASSGTNNPNYGKLTSDETKTKMRLNSPKNMSCIINNIKYISIRCASRILNISASTIRIRLKSNTPKWSEWQYLDSSK